MLDLTVEKVIYFLAGISTGFFLGLIVGNVFSKVRETQLKLGQSVAIVFLMIGSVGIIIEMVSMGTFKINNLFYYIIGMSILILNPQMVDRLYKIMIERKK